MTQLTPATKLIDAMLADEDFLDRIAEFHPATVKFQRVLNSEEVARELRLRGWSPFETAASFLPFAVALIGTNLLAAPTVGKLGAEATTVVGFLIAGTGLAWLAVLDPATAYLTVILPAQALLAIGIALVFSGAAVLATANVPQEQMGLAGGVMNTAMELGPTVGFAVLMAVVAMQADTVEVYASAFATASGLYGVAAAIAWVVAAKRRRYSVT
jgi:MFS family permease